MRLPILFALLALAPPGAAQVRFSIDLGGPTISVADSGAGVGITEADLLVPATAGGWPAPGWLGPPSISTSGGVGPPAVGLALPGHAGCIGHAPGLSPGCELEVDALSSGNACNLDPALPYMVGANVLFSVDNFTNGVPCLFAPSVHTEAAFGETAADVFADVALQPVPMPPGSVTPANVGVIDGNGMATPSTLAYPGLGLVEPTPPGAWPTGGDNLDALDVHGPFLPGAALYFSLESSFPDPINGAAASGSAAASGFVGGDVLVSSSTGAPPALYASAIALGLDLAGPDTDDLDALVVWENGDGAFTRSLEPFGWTDGASDMVLFSVRRGSAVIGVPDSLFSVSIEEGDILTAPTAPGAPPAILFAAENLGLITARTHFVPYGDDIDAAATSGTPLFDCDQSGIEDALDVAFGLQSDVNADGVPDVCQLVANPYCFGVSCLCGNDDLTAGCANSSGAGGRLSASGTSVHGADDLVLTAAGLPGPVFGLFYMGVTATQVPYGDGYRCAAGATQRFAIQVADAAGTMVLGPGLVSTSLGFPAATQIVPGATWHFQGWYRDPGGPCAETFNLTNGLAVQFLP